MGVFWNLSPTLSVSGVVGTPSANGLFWVWSHVLNISADKKREHAFLLLDLVPDSSTCRELRIATLTVSLSLNK